MIYLMIDNTSLLQLSKNTDSVDYVGQLEHLISSNEVTLFTHVTLNEEWNTHKNKWEGKADKSTNRSQMQGQGLISEPRPSDLWRERNVKILDRLLKAAQTLPHNVGLQQEVGERIDRKCAPFRGGSHKGTKDWNILGSFCIYCSDYGVNALYFVSHNYTDFAGREDKSQIDPSIAIRFPKVKIKYYTNYSDFFSIAESLGSRMKSTNYSAPISNKFSFRNSNISTRKNEKIIDSLFHLFDKIYNELAFVPPNMLLKMYPFSISESDTAYYSNSTGVNVNKSVIDLFKSISIQDKAISFNSSKYLKNCDRAEVKMRAILTRLEANQIFHLKCRETHHSIKLEFLEHESDHCFERQYYDFSYNHLNMINNTDKEDLISRIRISYILFQVGEFYKSYVVLNEVMEIAQREEKYLLYLVCLYNLSQLSDYATGPIYPNGGFSQHIIDKLQNLNFDIEANRIRDRTNDYLVLRLQNDTFHYYALEKIVGYANNIENHYQSQLNGGWSQNNNIENLTHEFYQLEGFLNGNGIFYNHYSNFTNLFQNVLRGLFGSYAISTEGGSSISAINDYWVIQILSYGTYDTILRHINHFKIKTLKYRSTHPEFEFVKLACNFFENFRDQNFVSYLEKNSFLKNKMRKDLENFVSLGAFLELDETLDASFLSMVIGYYVKGDSYQQFYRHLITLLRKKARFATIATVEELIKYCCANTNEEKAQVLLACLSSAASDSKKLKKALADNLIDLENNPDCSEIAYSWIVSELYRILPRSRKNHVHKAISMRAYQKTNISLTCMALLDDLVPMNETAFYTLFAYVDLSNRRYFGDVFRSVEKNFYNESINNIINVCFKFKLDTTKTEFDRFRSECEYYNWLLNIDHFNYDNFSAEWILCLDTKFAFERMAECSKFIRFLDMDRKTQKDERIKSATTEIFSKLIR